MYRSTAELCTSLQLNYVMSTAELCTSLELNYVHIYSSIMYMSTAELYTCLYHETIDHSLNWPHCLLQRILRVLCCGGGVDWLHFDSCDLVNIRPVGLILVHALLCADINYTFCVGIHNTRVYKYNQSCHLTKSCELKVYFNVYHYVIMVCSVVCSVMCSVVAWYSQI